MRLCESVFGFWVIRYVMLSIGPCVFEKDYVFWSVRPSSQSFHLCVAKCELMMFQYVYVLYYLVLCICEESVRFCMCVHSHVSPS